MPDREAGHESRGRCNERFFFLVADAAGVARRPVTVCGPVMGNVETVQLTHTSRWLPDGFRDCARPA